MKSPLGETTNFQETRDTLPSEKEDRVQREKEKTIVT